MDEVERMRKVDIHTILGLPSNGRRHTVICPFHKDTKPSLVVYPNGGGFHCFACGAHGNNAIDFVMLLGYDFNNAIKELKDYA